jgi:adenine-specific DNA-methyltransferase
MVHARGRGALATKIDALLRRIPDASLRAELAAELRDLRDQASFGLTFERHLPERVRLPRQTVRRGVIVEPRDGTIGPTGVVGRIRDGVALVTTAEEESVEAPVEDLVVVRDFGQPIYPGFTPLGQVSQGGRKPDHVVVRAENYHALETLQYTHQGKVDLIYIDPPYNTGGDLIYNDRYVSSQDAYRHSKWLSFMERRLELAKPLLAETGVILVAIDDNEHAHLKVLMDVLFGETNFLANITWQGAGKNSGRFGAGGVDYMLAYAASKPHLWRLRRVGSRANPAWMRSKLLLKRHGQNRITILKSPLELSGHGSEGCRRSIRHEDRSTTTQ